MNTLEHRLIILTERIRQSGNEELADAASALAAAAHNDDPCVMADGSSADDALAEMNAE